MISPSYVPASAEAADVWHISVSHEVIVHGNIVGRTRLILERMLGFPRSSLFREVFSWYGAALPWLLVYVQSLSAHIYLSRLNVTPIPTYG